MNNENKKITILEEIIEDVSKALFQKWINAVPSDKQSEENILNLNKNSAETTYFVIQMFMDKFNEAAEELKAKD